MCSKPLILTKVETEEPGFDLRTYYCAACEEIEVDHFSRLTSLGGHIEPTATT